MKSKLRYVTVDFDSVMKSASESFDKAMPCLTLSLFGPAGGDIVKHLMEILTEKGFFPTTAEREIVRDVNRKLLHVAVEFDSVMKSASESFDKAVHYLTQSFVLASPAVISWST